MNQLVDSAKGYLESEGYEVESRDGLLDGRRGAIGGQDRILVWVPDVDSHEQITRRQAHLIGEFGMYADRAPQASKLLLVPSTAGLTTDFRKTARYLNVRILVPAQFFDTEMRWELGTGSSPSRRLADDGTAALARRVPQPATFDFENKSCDDLLPYLFDELRSTSGKSIHLVVGPAGMGKSYLFEALFAKLYEAFQRDKRSLVLSRRPFALLPDHLRRGSSSSATVRSILTDYLNSEFARRLSRDSFEWRLTNGSGVWLIDGLDEIIARDPDFFSDLLDLETSYGTTPTKILICVRDSLLSTDQALREFCSYHGEEMSLYRLEPWGRDALETYAQSRLGRSEARRYVEQVTATEDLLEIAAVPFYASMLADEYEDGSLRSDAGRIGLLKSALDRILEREYDKGLLDRDLISKDSVVEVLESLAGKDFEDGFQGVVVSDVREYAQIVLPAELDPLELDRHVSNISQLALFVTGGEGLVRFLQEPMEQYLLGRYLALRVNDDQLFSARLSGRSVPIDWVTWDVVADAVRQANGQGNLLPLASLLQFRPGFNNLMRLSARLSDDLPLSQFPLVGSDLSDIIFTNATFDGCSFEDANLTNVIFRNCDLSNCDFRGATLANTGFIDGTELLMVGATFGDLTHLHSIATPAGFIDDHAAAAEWIHGRSTLSEVVIEPCPAAQQLRHLFGKYVTPLGTPRRYKLPSRALLRGEKSFSPKRTLEEAIRHEYLARPDARDHVARCDGDGYPEMIEWVRSLSMTPGIRALLDDVCDVADCLHVRRSA